jgi:hypothetical protein
MSVSDKQKYYEYDPGEGGKWWNKTPPVAEPWFQAELNLLAGYSDRGQPKLRAIWAGNLLHDITHTPQLKYKAVREIITGYNYVKEDGSVGITKSMNLPKDARVPWEFHPRTERLELGRLRWVIERHVPAHELRAMGRFKNLYAPDGERILRDLPEEGVYDHFFWVQTAAHRYRDLDREVLTAVQAMYLYNLNTSEAQKTLDVIEQEKNQILIGAEEAREVWKGL